MTSNSSRISWRGVILEQVCLVHLASCDVGEKDQGNKLHKELAVEALLRRNGKSAQVQAFLKIVKRLFNQILLAVNLQRSYCSAVQSNRNSVSPRSDRSSGILGQSSLQCLLINVLLNKIVLERLGVRIIPR